MATSLTSNFELTRDGVIKHALRLCGVLNVSQEAKADDLAAGAELLSMVLHDMQTEGILPLQVTRTTLSVTASTAEFTLPADTVDVVVDANNFAGTIFPSGATESPVYAVSRSEYIAIPDKDTEATPTRVFIERVATVKVAFWPLASEAMTFRYQQLRFPRDLEAGTLTLDVSRRWQLALVYELASHLAFVKSVTSRKRDALRKEAAFRMARCRASDVEKTNMQMVPGRYW